MNDNKQDIKGFLKDTFKIGALIVGVGLTAEIVSSAVTSPDGIPPMFKALFNDEAETAKKTESPAQLAPKP